MDAPQRRHASTREHLTAEEFIAAAARPVARSSMLTGLMMAKIGALVGFIWRPAATMPGGVAGWLVYLLAQHLTDPSRPQRSRVRNDWTAPTLRPGTLSPQPQHSNPSLVALLGVVMGTVVFAAVATDVITIFTR